MIQFDKFISRDKAFSEVEMQAIMNTGVTGAMNKGRTVETLYIGGAWFAVSYHPTNISDMIRVGVARGKKMVAEAFYFRR